MYLCFSLFVAPQYSGEGDIRLPSPRDDGVFAANTEARQSARR